MLKDTNPTNHLIWWRFHEVQIGTVVYFVVHPQLVKPPQLQKPSMIHRIEKITGDHRDCMRKKKRWHWWDWRRGLASSTVNLPIFRLDESRAFSSTKFRRHQRTDVNGLIVHFTCSDTSFRKCSSFCDEFDSRTSISGIWCCFLFNLLRFWGN